MLKLKFKKLKVKNYGNSYSTIKSEDSEALDGNGQLSSRREHGERKMV